MTPPKIWYAKKLSELRIELKKEDETDPEILATQMRTSRLCYEIEKLEDEIEQAKEPEAAPPLAEDELKEIANKKKNNGTKSFWSRFIFDSESDIDSD
jgi:hypothetical protein